MSSQNPFGNPKFDVEHVLDLYADSFLTFPAAHLYEEDFVKNLRAGGRSFHIYCIGYVPKVQKIRFFETAGALCADTLVGGKKHKLSWTLPSGTKFKQVGESFYLENERGERGMIGEVEWQHALHTATGGLPFQVKYIGQAYGSDGSRDALDRLLKHETLQKIAVKGAPKDSLLQVLLLELQTDTRIITAFMSGAQNKDDQGQRRKNGVDKLFGTTDAERVSLYEAALIRYFSPEFNKEFKNSFPSTNLKILKECYQKDFLAVVAQICFDEFPFALCSETVARKFDHIVTHDLHGDKDRRVFLGMDEAPPLPQKKKRRR